MVVEICANSAQSCVEAQRGGAHRVELCAAIPEGGTTPSWGEMVVAREAINIKMNVIIRPRGGDFLYSDMEFRAMLLDIEAARRAGADGVVFGCLRADGSIDIERNAQLIAASKGMSTTFHRAFDVCADPFVALEELIELGFDRILTSGQESNAVRGAALIADLVTKAAGRIIIMPGCGVNENNIAQLRQVTGASEFHFSARHTLASDMEYRNDKVSMGGTVCIDEFKRDVTSAERVAMTIKKVVFLIIGLSFLSVQLSKSQSNIDNLRKDVFTLAADSMKGRLTTTVENKKAADYIVSQFDKAGVKPYLDSTYFHTFPLNGVPIYLVKNYIELDYQDVGRNVIGVVRGRDSSLRNEYIVVGAHYDHIGYKLEGDSVSVFNGADDNASGVAMMLETARYIQANPLPCSVVFVAFDAEEQGLIGSRMMIKDSVVPLDRIKIAFSLDMVGGLSYGERLEYGDVKYLDNWRKVLFVMPNDDLRIEYTQMKNPAIGTDSDSFLNAGVVGIYVNTGLETPFHRPEDDAELIDYDGMVMVTNHFIKLLEHLDIQSKFKFVLLSR